MILFGINLPIIEALVILHVLTIFFLVRILLRLDKNDEDFTALAEQVLADDHTTPTPSKEQHKPKHDAGNARLRKLTKEIVEEMREKPEEEEVREP